MKVMLTGAFGNVGEYTIDQLLSRGHRVCCFDLPTPRNRRTARRFGQRIEIVWGDLRRREDVDRAADGQDAIIHVGYIIPPQSEQRPEWARTINVGGMQNLIAAAQAQPIPPRFLFTSTYALYGDTQHLPPPLRVDTPIAPLEHYSHHKVESENLLCGSGLTWCILRLGAAMPVKVKPETWHMMFNIAPDLRIETVHPDDVALAITNALETEQAWGRIMLIGGGKTHQMRFRDLAAATLEATGIGMLSDSVFHPKPFHCDWMDTEESEALLHYQRHDFQAYLTDLQRELGPLRTLARLFRPWARAYMIWLSRRTS